MSEFISTNGRLACEPFVVEKEEALKKGFATVKKSNVLLKTKVVVPDDKGKYIVGDTVYFRPDVLNHPWTKEVYRIIDTDVVFLDETFVVLSFRKEDVSCVTAGACRV